MFPYSLIKKLIKILHSEENPNQIAAGFALGAIIGLLPGLSLITLGIWIAVFLLNVNIAGALAGIAIFKLVGFATDTLADKLGYYLLADVSWLYPIWTQLYNTPIIPFTRFNNTVILGSFVIGLVLLIPVMLAMKYFVIIYRAQIRQRLERIKFFQILKASKFYQWYAKMRSE